MQDFVSRPLLEDASQLELDFSSPRPRLVTQLLCASLRDADGRAPHEGEVWDWTLHRRLQALIAIERAAGNRRDMLQTRCPHESCGEPMEMELDLERFVLADQPPRFELEVAPGLRLEVRLPSGADQQRWHDEGTHPGAPETRLARDLVEGVDGTPLGADDMLDPKWLDLLADVLEERDPLTALRLDARCPACGGRVPVQLDLEAHLLERAAARQARLLDAVHRLASAYHWSEREILALPRGRRQQYLARVQAEALS